MIYRYAKSRRDGSQSDVFRYGTFRALSPFAVYPGRIPIPGMLSYTHRSYWEAGDNLLDWAADSVEGVWQGLKCLENGTDERLFHGQPKKRRGRPEGHLFAGYRLLDYGQVGAAVLDWSRAQVALMRPSRSSRALEAIVRDLIATPDGTAYFADRVRGVSLRYDLGEEHPLVGRSVPDFELCDGLRIGQHLRSGRGVLLDFMGDERLAAIASAPPNLDYLPCTAQNQLGLRTVLIRPDGVVAWAAETDGGLDSASRAVNRWFGS